MESLSILLRCSFFTLIAHTLSLAVDRTVIETESERIINGKVATPGQFPYVVRFAYKRQVDSLCTGAFITTESVLLAAHCVTGEDGKALSPDAFEGFFDSVEIDKDEKRITFSEVRVHEYYKPNTTNDIAILILKEDKKLKKLINVVALPKKGVLFDGKSVFAVGWGMDGFDEDLTSKVLRYTEASVQKTTACKKEAGDDLHVCIISKDSKICAFESDSGGPVVIKGSNVDLSIGVASYVFSEDKCDTPDIYSSTSIYHDWIKDNAVGKITYAKI